MIKKCVVCGEEFEVQSINAILCSPKCKLARGAELARTRRATAVEKQPLKIKYCTICGKVMFRHRPYAITCSKNCRAELGKQRSKQWRENNLNYAREKCRENYRRHKDERLSYGRQWRLKNPNKRKEADRKWRDNNSSRVSESRRIWRMRNPEKCKVSKQKYHAKLRAAEIALKELETKLSQLELTGVQL